VILWNYNEIDIMSNPNGNLTWNYADKMVKEEVLKEESFV
jgi:hypothetical protein